MSFKSYTRKIQETLDALSKAKTSQEKLKLLFMMKVYIEILQKPLKKQRDKKRMAYHAKTRIIKKALRQLLTALERIFAKHEEVGDSAVRDQMYAAIYRSFIQPQRGYSLPETFGMFSDKGNEMVREALHKFLTHPEILAASKALKSAEDRFAAFQDDDVKTSQESDCFEYFGYSNKVRVA
jgi:hypothetical protein